MANYKTSSKYIQHKLHKQTHTQMRQHKEQNIIQFNLIY